MTPLEQRIAIAESVGKQWTIADTASSGYTSWQDYIANWGIEVLDDEMPDYLNDLNAMHEVEKKLSLDNRHIYYNYLWHICDREHRMASVPGWLVPTATSAQRAEAYLRTIGKWKD